MTENSPRGVLLELGGTLIDSNDAHAHAWVAALAASGFDVPFARVRRLIGMGGDKLLPEVAQVTKDSPQGQRISADWERIFTRDYQPHLRSFPQVRALVQRLRQAGLKVAIASSSQAAQLDALLRIADIADLLDDTTSSDDAAQSKPAPNIVGAARRKIGLAPMETLLLGTPPMTSSRHGRPGCGRSPCVVAAGTTSISTGRSRSTTIRRICSRASAPRHS